MAKSDNQIAGNGPDTVDIVTTMSDRMMDQILTPFVSWLEKKDTLHIGAKMALRLILEELLANTVMHSCAEHGTEIRLSVSLDRNGVSIQFCDCGVAFNPETDLPQDSRENDLDDRPVGQLGWPLILNYCSITGYERKDDQNRLSLRFQYDG